jgi:succinate-semialdehyde dehydrogenase
MDVQAHVSELIEKARVAQKVFEEYPQERVDEAVRAIGKAVYDSAELLARMAVDETGMGNYEDKIVKNRGKPKVTWQKLKGVKSRGVIRYIEEEGIAEVAKPMGVIGAVTPVTNPVITHAHNAMIALKGGNAIILCSHPKGDKTGKKTVEIMREALKGIGAPEDLIQITAESTMEISGALMKMADVCVSTGGPGLVKAAYSSGKPAFGVGAGNVQCLMDRDADIEDAVTKIIKGRIYDNGILCTGEQAVHIPRERAEEIIAAFETQGSYYVSDPAEVDRFRKTLFTNGAITRSLMGSDPVTIAKAAGSTIAADTKVIVIRIEKTGAEELLAKEKLFPVLALYVYDAWEEAVAKAAANIDNEGMGHSAAIHSFTKENIEYAANRIRASRFVVNQAAASSLGGTLTNGLHPTTTLGCGTWGNNSLSENLWFRHLVNISRIAYEIKDAPAATLSDEEIWSLH